MAGALDNDPINQLEKNLQCSVCLEVLTDPRTLPCCHSFCKKCLEGTVETCRGKASLGQPIREFPCPYCRTTFILDPDKHVADMPRNHFICNMVKATAVLHRGIGVPCSHNCSQSYSVARCVTCEKFLCRECLTAHNNYRGNNGHSVLTMEYLSKPENCKKINDKMYCSEHSGMELKIYCETCDQLICRDCMDFKHVKQDHSCVLVKDEANKYKELLASKNKAMEDALTEGNAFLQQLTLTTEQLDLNAENIRIQIAQKKDIVLNTVTEMLEKETNTLSKKVDDIRKVKRAKVEKQAEETKLYVEKIKTSVQLSEKLVDQGTEGEIISSQKMMLDNAKNLLTNREKYFKAPIPVAKLRYSSSEEPISKYTLSTLGDNLGDVNLKDEGSSRKMSEEIVSSPKKVDKILIQRMALEDEDNLLGTREECLEALRNPAAKSGYTSSTSEETINQATLGKPKTTSKLDFTDEGRSRIEELLSLRSMKSQRMTLEKANNPIRTREECPEALRIPVAKSGYTSSTSEETINQSTFRKPETTSKLDVKDEDGAKMQPEEVKRFSKTESSWEKTEKEKKYIKTPPCDIPKVKVDVIANPEKKNPQPPTVDSLRRFFETGSPWKKTESESFIKTPLPDTPKAEVDVIASPGKKNPEPLTAETRLRRSPHLFTSQICREREEGNCTDISKDGHDSNELDTDEVDHFKLPPQKGSSREKKSIFHVLTESREFNFKNEDGVDPDEVDSDEVDADEVDSECFSQKRTYREKREEYFKASKPDATLLTLLPPPSFELRRPKDVNFTNKDGAKMQPEEVKRFSKTESSWEKTEKDVIASPERKNPELLTGDARQRRSRDFFTSQIRRVRREVDSDEVDSDEESSWKKKNFAYFSKEARKLNVTNKDGAKMQPEEVKRFSKTESSWEKTEKDVIASPERKNSELLTGDARLRRSRDFFTSQIRRVRREVDSDEVDSDEESSWKKKNFAYFSREARKLNVTNKDGAKMQPEEVKRFSKTKSSWEKTEKKNKFIKTPLCDIPKAEVDVIASPEKKNSELLTGEARQRRNHDSFTSQICRDRDSDEESSREKKDILYFLEEAEKLNFTIEGRKPATDDKRSKNDECPICLTVFTQEKTLLKCGHSFCTKCIDEAFKTKKLCPLCSTKYGRFPIWPFFKRKLGKRKR